MKVASIKLLLCVVLVPSMLSACNDTPAKIEPPINWQAHLKLAKLPKDFIPQLTEKVYVPLYSHIYYEDPTRRLELVGTLSVRNTDPTNSMIVNSIQYYDTDGKLIEKLIEHPIELGPFGTVDVVVPRTNDSGGSGANFVVEWMSAKKIAEPIIESIMVSTGSAQSVSFTSRGSVIYRNERPHSN